MATYKDSYQSGPSPLGLGMTPVVRKLLWINIAIALVVLLLSNKVAWVGALYEWLSLDVARWRELAPFVPLWQLLTYGFVHSASDPFHMLWNMLALYFLGCALEGILGSTRFAWFYLFAIVAPGAAQLATSLVVGSDFSVVGASGAILAIVVAMAVFQPHAIVMLFGMVPIKLWVIATVYVVLDVIGLVNNWQGVAHLVHLSGAAVGFVAVKTGWIWMNPSDSLRRSREVKAAETEQNDEQKLDQLLERIHREGIGSLSDREREFLKRMSSRKTG